MNSALAGDEEVSRPTSGQNTTGFPPEEGGMSSRRFSKFTTVASAEVRLV